jgi:2-amino-4-hydroxy-6-hydroxymethyldihydropteridine diphosphokinase
MRNYAFIALGSNIDAEKNINRAFTILNERFGLIEKAGPVITSPLGIRDQPDFLNAVVVLSTSLEQNELATHLKNIEDEIGRDRNRPKYGPREIDLDVIIWNDQVVDTDYYDRDFLQNLVRAIRH